MGDYQDRIEITHPVSNRLAKYHTFEGVKLIGQLGYEWYTDTLNVKSYDPGTKIMVFTENSLMGIYDTFENNTYLFYNVSEELDHQDEYWFDPSSGVLYVYDPKSDFTLSTGGTFITANGSDFVNVVGMKFICTTGGGFSVSANDFTIDRCLFFGIGARGGSQLYGNRNRLLNSEFRELSGHGVSVSGGDSVHLVKSGNIVDNCLFDTFSQVYRSATQGISCGGVGNTISHCEFVNSPYIAISYGG